jgi:hypothetical protein
VFLVDLLVALAVAMLISAVFAAVFRPSGPFWLPFVVILLAAWAAGVWVRPVGPPAWGAFWLGPLAVGGIVALILASALPSTRRPPSPTRPPPPPPRPQEALREDDRTVPSPVDARTADVDTGRSALTAAAVLWGLVLVLIVAVLFGYLWP